MDEHEIERLATLPAYAFDAEHQRALAELRARYLACSGDTLHEPEQCWQAYEAEKEAVEQRFAAAARRREQHPTRSAPD